MILIFLSALAVGFSGAMMPGSLLTYTIRKSLSNGPRSGFIIAAGHAFLELILIILIFLGFDTILKSNWAQITIGIIGGLLLVFMGLSMILNSARNRISIKVDNEGEISENMLLSGMIISAANPYFILWWAVVGLGFIMQAYNSFGLAGIALYYIGHIGADFIWYGLVSVIVGTTRKFIKQNIYRISIVILGCLLVFFGGRFVYDAVSGLINQMAR